MKFPAPRSTCRIITDDDKADRDKLSVFAMLGVWDVPGKNDQKRKPMRRIGVSSTQPSKKTVEAVAR